MNKGRLQPRPAATAPPDWHAPPVLFADVGARQVIADFSAGDFASDGGVLLRPVDSGSGFVPHAGHLFPRRLKVAAVVTVNGRRVRVQLSRAWPGRASFVRAGAGLVVSGRGLTTTCRPQSFGKLHLQAEGRWICRRICQFALRERIRALGSPHPKLEAARFQNSSSQTEKPQRRLRL